MLGTGARPRPSGSAVGFDVPGFGRAKSVLVVFTSGGQSQLDTWDPSRTPRRRSAGRFGTIPTRVPGLRVCEHMPRLAALHHRYTVLRSMTHDDLDHGSACYLALTGQFHPQKSSNPPPRAPIPRRSGRSSTASGRTADSPHAAFHVNGPLLDPERSRRPASSAAFSGAGTTRSNSATSWHRPVDGMTRARLPAERLDARPICAPARRRRMLATDRPPPTPRAWSGRHTS